MRSGRKISRTTIHPIRRAGIGFCAACSSSKETSVTKVRLLPLRVEHLDYESVDASFMPKFSLVSSEMDEQGCRSHFFSLLS
eukprot:653493-Rhodomonas_salina.1